MRDPDRAPLTGLTCATLVDQEAISVANDCSSGVIETKGPPPGTHAFSYRVSDGRDFDTADVILELSPPTP